MFWHNIYYKTVLLAVLMIPAIAIGAILGAFIIKKINEKPFRLLIIGVTAISAIRLLF
ncbi:hypothetical protein RCG17_15590 [Neobacillus sp. PS3-12]|nr:hypothetical protein [Neobacillus sp. PS3-12]WML50933.1 hypothetical protein RCG17_15590 [Neobacillus sp. PS3-12]